MSENEFLWWVARSTKKPLPAIRDDINVGRQLCFSMGNSGKDRPFKTVKSAVQDWYAIPDAQNEELHAYAQSIINKQQQEKEKNNV